MNRIPQRRSVVRRFAAGLRWFALSAVFGLAPGAFADTVWKNTGTGSWAETANWTAGVPNGEDVTTIDNGGTARLATGVFANAFVVQMGTTDGASGSLEIAGGNLSAYIGFIGFSQGSSGSATISAGSWIHSATLYVGSSGNGTLQVTGGVVRNTIGWIGSSGGTGSVTVSGGTWNNTSNLTVGSLGANNTLAVQTGGTVLTGGNAVIGEGYSTNPAVGGGNQAGVSGQGSIWSVANSFTVGNYASNNFLTVSGQALVQIGNSADDTLRFSALGASSNNFLQLDGGYVALFGNRIETFGDLIADGVIQLWDGSAWVVSTDPDDFLLSYFTTNESAEAFSGYSNLGGYTILTTVAVPEPSAILLAALGIAATLLARRRPSPTA